MVTTSLFLSIKRLFSVATRINQTESRQHIYNSVDKLYIQELKQLNGIHMAGISVVYRVEHNVAYKLCFALRSIFVNISCDVL